MTITTQMTLIAKAILEKFSTDKKAKEEVKVEVGTNEHNDYKKAVYPLFGLMRKSRAINDQKREQGKSPFCEMKEYASTFFNAKDSALQLAIKSAEAFMELRNGYQITPLINGDFIATRESVSAYVRALPCTGSLFHRAAEVVTENDIIELATLKEQHNCSAAIYLSFSHSDLKQKFYCKTKDVFGLDGLTLFTLLTKGKFKSENDYIEQQTMDA